MEHEHTIHALARKYADLAADIKRLRGELKAAEFNLEHIRATLLMFDPAYPVAHIHIPRPKPPQKPITDRNRRALEILRTTAAPMTTREIARAWLLEKTGEPIEVRTLDATSAALHSLLKRVAKRGEVRLVSESPARWRTLID